MTKEEVVLACKEAIQQELGPFFIEREQHFLDHTFIKSVRETKENITSTACKAVTRGGIVGLGVLLGYGVVEWLKRSGLGAVIAKFL